METPRRQRAATADGQTPHRRAQRRRPVHTPSRDAARRLERPLASARADAGTAGGRTPAAGRPPLPSAGQASHCTAGGRSARRLSRRERKLPSSGATVAVPAESVVASHAVTAGRRHLPRAFTRAEHAPAKARAQRLRPGGAGGERFACPPETRKETRVCTTENSRTIDLCNTYEPQKRHVEQTQPDTERRAVARFTRTGATVRSNP